MPDSLDPYEIAVNLLTAVTTGYADTGIELPEHRVAVAGSLPAWDGPQLTVTLQRIYIGLPGVEEGARPLPNQQASIVGDFQVQLVRKATATLANAARRTLPTVTQLDLDAQLFMLDAKTLTRALQAARKAGTITGSGRSEYGRVKISATSSSEQQGEYLGMGANVQVLLG